MKRKRTSLRGFWNPDRTTTNAIKRGQRKLRDHAPALAAERPHESGIITDDDLKGEVTMATRKTSTKKAPVRKASKKGAAKKAPAKKAETTTNDNLIPLKKICQELKLDPRAARRRLRNADLPWHDTKARWAFTASQAKKVKAVLEAPQAAEE